MTAPHRILVKYNDEAFLVKGSSLIPLDPQDQTEWNQKCIERASNWKRGLLVNLQAAMAFDDVNDMRDGAGLEDSLGGE